MTRRVFKNGRWYEGRAGPEHIDKDLASLPSSYVTKEHADEDRVHALDPPHIRRAVAHERMVNEVRRKKEEPITTLRRAPAGEVVPLRQDFIDVEKMFVMKGMVAGQLREIERGQRTEPDLVSGKHLWFPENNVNNWLVRDGWAPPDSERPRHLRGFELNVDLMNIPQRVRDALAANGMDARYFLDKILRPKKQSNLIEVV